jgi:hypothetical protein
MVVDLLVGRSGLRIVDVGCGADVLDAPPEPLRGRAGDRLQGAGDFDVMEHIPLAERPAFVAGPAARLDGDGS